jgi:hypothetical protein
VKVLNTATGSIIVLPEDFHKIRHDLNDLINPPVVNIAFIFIFATLTLNIESIGNNTNNVSFLLLSIVLLAASPLIRLAYVFFSRRSALDMINSYEIKADRQLIRVVMPLNKNQENVCDIQQNGYFSLQAQKIEKASNLGFVRSIDLSIEVRENLISEDGLDVNNSPVSTVCIVIIELDNDRKISIESNSLDVSSHSDNQQAFRDFISVNQKSVERIKIFLAQ